MLPGFRLSSNLKGMEVYFTPEQEAQIAEIATRAGTAPEDLVKGAVLRFLENESSFRAPVAELPVWHLGARGPFRRRDLYDAGR